MEKQRPKMELIGQDGNIFSILGRASRLLKENGQPDQAKEMCDRVYQSGDYYKALNIISEYVETELSEKTPSKQKKRSDPERKQKGRCLGTKRKNGLNLLTKPFCPWNTAAGMAGRFCMGIPCR